MTYVTYQQDCETEQNLYQFQLRNVFTCQLVYEVSPIGWAFRLNKYSEVHILEFLWRPQSHTHKCRSPDRDSKRERPENRLSEGQRLEYDNEYSVSIKVQV